MFFRNAHFHMENIMCLKKLPAHSLPRGSHLPSLNLLVDLSTFASVLRLQKTVEIQYQALERQSIVKKVKNHPCEFGSTYGPLFLCEFHINLHKSGPRPIKNRPSWPLIGITKPIGSPPDTSTKSHFRFRGSYR